MSLYHLNFIWKSAFCQMENTRKNIYEFYNLMFYSGQTNNRIYNKLIIKEDAMKNKKIIVVFAVLLIVVLVGGYFGIKYAKNKAEEKNQSINEEYTPEEEITEEQARQTIISLYFPAKETKELMPEARLIDIKELINNPYEKIMQLLIEGPKSDKEEKVVPDGTKVLKTFMENDCLTLDLSAEFLNFDKTNEKSKEILINCIVNSMTELTEVNQVKILINGNQSDEFKEVYKRVK